MRARFHFLTLFPDTIQVWLSSSILGRALRSGLFSFELHQLRDFSSDRHRSVDDLAYGGGGGMVLKLEPLVAAVETIQKSLSAKATVLYFSPAGERMTQSRINALVPPSDKTEEFILVCGHYEGIDQRFIDHWVDRSFSLGDFVLTGGELPAVAFADALIRQLEGVLRDEDAPRNESFSLQHPGTGTPLLEYPHYTRPAEFRGHRVPDILLSGDHAKIEAWRLEQARQRTSSLRPDLLKSF